MIEEYQSKKRKISGFFAEQMLFEYYEGFLDPVRHQAVEEALENDPRLQQELKFIKAADEYCKKLSATRMDEDFLIEISKNKRLSDHLFIIFKWSKWPEIVRWTAEAVLISAAVVGLIVIVPWSNIRDMVDIKKSAEIRFEEEQNRLANIQVEAIEKSIEEPSRSTAQPKPIQEKPSKSVVVPTVAEPTVAVAVVSPAPAKPTETKPVIQGLLYRMMMTVPSIGEKAGDLKRKIKDMGGVKAGNVELGWRKPNGNYYHFSFPESRYQNLLSVLGEYGPVRVYKNPHERVMPEGQIRIILWIEDPPNENSSTAEAVDSDTNSEEDDNSVATPSDTEAEGESEFPPTSGSDEQ